MEPYNEYNISNQDALDVFFKKSKELQRYAFMTRTNIPCATYTKIIVTDEYALVESGHISPARGLRGVFPGRTVCVKWLYSTKSGKCRQLSDVEKYTIQQILSSSPRYNFCDKLPHQALSGTILKDILYGKITNARDAIIKYGKRIGVKHMNKHVFSFAHTLGISPVLLTSVVNPAQLETCHEMVESKYEDHHLRRTFADMVGQAYSLGKTINLLWSEKRMADEHTNWTRQLMLLELEDKSEDPVWSDDIVSSVRYLTGLELLNTEHDVFVEGFSMSHCVYTNYWSLIKAKRYLAFHIDLPEPVTVGLRYGNNSYIFDQASHKRNGKLSMDEKAVIEQKVSQLSALLTEMVKDVKIDKVNPVFNVEFDLPW